MKKIILEKQKVLQAKRKIKFCEKPVYDASKRIFDVILSFIALFVLFIPLCIVALVIVIDTPGNPLYAQTRVGQNGRYFTIYKFRSMKINADDMKTQLMEQNNSNGANFKIQNDPRITRVGKFLRDTSVDELPQLINILKGDMSIVGPRPFIPEEQAKLPFDRLLVKPGLSCYWQISGKNNLTKKQQIFLDRKYIKERSHIVDFVIIIKTLGVVFKKDNG